MSLVNISRPYILLSDTLDEHRRWQKHTSDNIDRINLAASTAVDTLEADVATLEADIASIVAGGVTDGSVTLAKLANLAQDQFIGRVTASTGVPETATITAAARTVLDDTTVAAMRTTLGAGDALVANPLSQFAATTSLQLKGVISDETGSGALVFADSPVFTTPNIGSATGSISGNAATVTTNANLTGPVTSVGNTTTIADAELAALAGLTSAANKGIQFTGSGTAATYDLTTAGKALLDDADNIAQRATLGLGTLATQSGTFSGTSSGTNTGDQTITLTGGVTGSGTGSFAATVVTNANLTGPITSTGNATAVTNNAVTDAMIRQSAGLSVMGRSANTTGNEADIIGTDGQVLRVSGTALGFGSIAAAAMPALTGDVTTSAGAVATTIANNAVTNAKAAQMAGHSFKGNNTGSTANALDLTATQLTAELNAFTTSLQGVVPASGGGSVNFLRADGTFATPGLPAAAKAANIYLQQHFGGA